MASLAAINSSVAADQAPSAALRLYVNLFLGIGEVLVLTGVVLLLARLALQRLMHGAD